jgi:hypothetical protein
MSEPQHLTTLWAFTACYRDILPTTSFAPSNIRLIKSGKGSRVGHVARIREMRMAYILVRKLKKRNDFWDLV